MLLAVLDIILFDLIIIIIFFFYGTMLLFFMYEELSECIFTYYKTVVRMFFSQFCSDFDVYLDLV